MTTDEVFKCYVKKFEENSKFITRNLKKKSRILDYSMKVPTHITVGKRLTNIFFICYIIGFVWTIVESKSLNFDTYIFFKRTFLSLILELVCCVYVFVSYAFFHRRLNKKLKVLNNKYRELQTAHSDLVNKSLLANTNNLLAATISSDKIEEELRKTIEKEVADTNKYLEKSLGENNEN